MDKKKPNLLKETRIHFKPFDYPWAYRAWEIQQSLHWLPSEVPMADDINDWKKNLNDKEINLLTQIFRFFTQADVEVGKCYMTNYLQIFKPYEIKMMLTAIANNETIHAVAYAFLIDTLGMSETTYNEFMDYKAMKDKYDFLQGFNVDTPEETALTIAAIGGFQEGLALFASFAMLLNFPRFNKMKGMGQIISWSIRDEAVIKGTEVLCSDGDWKKIENLKISDKILQYSTEDRSTSFVSPEKIQHVTRNKTYSYIGDNFEQIVSPNHRMIIEKDDEITESTGEKLNVEETFNFILNGEKQGTLHSLSAKQKELCILSAKGEEPLEWVTYLMEDISRSWCKEFMELFFGNNINIGKTDFDILQAIVTLAGDQIHLKDGKLERSSNDKISSSMITKTENKHEDEQDLYCVSVPGKAFFIRSNNKVSVTGNSLHCETMILLYKEFLKENPQIDKKKLYDRIYEIAEKSVEHENAFIDLAFEMGGVEGMDSDDIKKYIMYIADRRLLQLGLKTKYGVKKNPIPWLEEILNGIEHSNFFEARSTEYSKAMLTGTWEEAYEEEENETTNEVLRQDASRNI